MSWLGNHRVGGDEKLRNTSNNLVTCKLSDALHVPDAIELIWSVS